MTEIIKIHEGAKHPLMDFFSYARHELILMGASP